MRQMWYNTNMHSTAARAARTAGGSTPVGRCSMFHYTIVTPSSDRPYYVYLLLRPDGRPFYVGKGCGERIRNHEQDAKRGHQCHKCNVIRKIWRNGGKIRPVIIFATANEQEAFDYEARLIENIGLGNLTNRLPGGGKERDPM